MHRAGSAAPNNSSFVDHLRLVHFALIASTLVALVAITSTSSSALERAYEELKQLIDLSQHWRNGEWLQEATQERRASIAKQRSASPQIRQVARYKLEAPLPITLAFLPPQPGLYPFPTSTRRLGTLDWLILTTGLNKDSTPLNGEPSASFQTLSDAKQVWNMLQDYKYAVILNGALDGWYIDQEGKSFELKKDSDGLKQSGRDEANDQPRNPSEALSRIRLYLRTDLLEELANEAERFSKRSEAAKEIIGRDQGNCYLATNRPGAGAPGLVILRAACTSEQMFWQALFTKELSPRPAPGNFSQSFPNIDDVAKNLSSLSLQQLQTYLVAERNRSGEKAEFFGIKFPAESVSIWGIAILIAVLGYFLAIFRDFSNRVTADDKAWDTPWIGISTEQLSRVVFVLTMLLPFSTSAYLAWRGAHLDKPAYILMIYWLAPFAMIILISAIMYTRLTVIRLRKI